VKTGLESTATTKAHRVGNSLVVKLIEKLGGLWVLIKFFLQTIERRPVLAIAFIMVSVLCLANGCKYDVTISMNGNVPPAFKFERGHVNYLDFFIVEEIAPENHGVSYMNQSSDKNIVIWQIWPKTSDDGRIDKLPIITYGEVPGGFSQKYLTTTLPLLLLKEESTKLVDHP
jgi:hypothetical protein